MIITVYLISLIAGFAAMESTRKGAGLGISLWDMAIGVLLLVGLYGVDPILAHATVLVWSYTIPVMMMLAAKVFKNGKLGILGGTGVLVAPLFALAQVDGWLMAILMMSLWGLGHVVIQAAVAWAFPEASARYNELVARDTFALIGVDISEGE